MGLGDKAKQDEDARTNDEGEVVPERSSGSMNPGPATDGVNAAGTAGGSDEGSGTTAAGATSPGPADEHTRRSGRHRAEPAEPEGGSQNPGPADLDT